MNRIPSSRLLPIVAVCAVTALAAAFRLWRLDTVPPGLFGDEAADGVVARGIADGTHWPLYVEEPEATKWGSREPLYHYLMAAVFAVAGATPTTLRLTSALIGIATVPLFFLLCRRIFGARVALLAAVLLAVSRWHVTLSRFGVRAILVPLWVVLTVLAFDAVVARRRGRAAVALGIALGGGLYTYPAYWAVPIALLVPLGLLRRRARAPAGAGRLAVIAVSAALVTAAPLLTYAALKPDYVLARAARAALAPAAADPLRDRLQRVVFMLHFRGDANARHNLPGAPMLDPLSGALFAVGLLVTLRGLRADPVRGGGLLAFWLVPLLPSALSDSAPHALRAIGALPAVCAIAARGLDVVARHRRVGRAAAAVTLAAIATLNSRDYFQRWAGSAAVAEAYSTDALRFARYAAGLAAQGDVYAVAAIVRQPQVRFLDPGARGSWHALDGVEAFVGDAGAGRDRFVISDRPDVHAVVELLYPNAEVLSRFTLDGRGSGRVYRIRAAALLAQLSDEQRQLVVYLLSRDTVGGRGGG